MASKRGFTTDDFLCPVCHDVYKNPVIMQCSHSVCKVCLNRFWETKRQRECPVCRKRSPTSELPINLALQNLCETYLEERTSGGPAGLEAQCRRHSQKLDFFCLEHEQLVCLMCKDSEEHENHNFIPIDEMRTGQYKVKMATLLDKLENKMKIQLYKTACVHMATHIKTQAKNTETQIKKEFETLHQFLQDEETAMIVALREEEWQKSQVMGKKIEMMDRAITSLPTTIRALKEEMEAEKMTFLQNYKSTMERAQSTLEDLEVISGALINVANHLGNLKFRVWEKMQDIVEYTPVTLDPNTASFELIMSEDLTSLKLGEERPQLPDNPERFHIHPGALASEGFDSGTHCWDVEVRDAMDWAVGVMEESGERKRFLSSKDRRWCFECHCGTEYSACSPTQDLPPRELRKMLQRIRVRLDWDQGVITFSDPDNNTQLYTLTHTFTERVFPFFQSLCEISPPLRILPVKVSVTVERLT